MGISHWAEALRPREKLLQSGPTSLSDPELLAIILRTGYTGCSAIQLAQQLLETFQGLKGFLDADPAHCCKAKGLGPAKYAQLQAALELSRRYLASEVARGTCITEPSMAARYLQASLQHRSHEVFVALFLDNQHRVITCEELFKGTLTSAQVYPREILKRCCQLDAAAVIFAHNHPSGCAEPSQSDIDLTRQLRQLLGEIDVRVLDHLIIGDRETTSLAERRLF